MRTHLTIYLVVQLRLRRKTSTGRRRPPPYSVLPVACLLVTILRHQRPLIGGGMHSTEWHSSLVFFARSDRINFADPSPSVGARQARTELSRLRRRKFAVGPARACGAAAAEYNSDAGRGGHVSGEFAAAAQSAGRPSVARGVGRFGRTDMNYCGESSRSLSARECERGAAPCR